jgi:ribosomal protein S18 acetylase RimI-like enzyme
MPATDSTLGVELVPWDPRWLDELVPMWRESFEQAIGRRDTNPIEMPRRHFVEDVLPRHAVRVARAGGELVGFVAADRESVSQLYVRRGWQGRGIGSALLEWAKAQSGGSLWLYTFERNAGARRFYERRGFEIVERGFEPTWQLADLKYRWERR